MAKKTSTAGPLVIDYTTQGVNLLPASARAAEELRILRSKLFLGMVVFAAILALVCGYSVIAETQAKHAIDLASDESDRLQGELERYADISALKSDITQAETAVRAGMGTEITWVDLIAKIEAALPAEGTITSFSATGTTPMDGNGFTATSPLATQGIGSIEFTMQLSSLPDTAAWLEALNGIPGFMDAVFGSATLTTGDDGGPSYYTVSSSVVINVEALSRAYLEDAS